MSKINIRPSGESFEINSETSLLDCLRENDIYIKSSCGGIASCSDCIIKITSGEDNLTSPPFEEIQLLGNVFHITKERLACQCKIISGDVTIDISGHDKSKDEKRLKNKTTTFNTSKTRVRKEKKVKELHAEREVVKAEKLAERTPDKEKEGGMKRPQPFISKDESESDK